MQTLPDPSAAAVQYQGSTVCNGIWNTRACKSPPEVYHRRATFFRFEELFAHFPRDCGSILETGISTRFIYEALLVRGFVERAYIATQAAENACSCLNTRDRSVYRPLLLFMYTRMALWFAFARSSFLENYWEARSIRIHGIYACRNLRWCIRETRSEGVYVISLRDLVVGRVIYGIWWKYYVS